MILFSLPPSAPDAPVCRVCDSAPVVPLPTVRGSEPDCCARCAVWFVAEVGMAIHRKFAPAHVAAEWSDIQRKGICEWLLEGELNQEQLPVQVNPRLRW